MNVTTLTIGTPVIVIGTDNVTLRVGHVAGVRVTERISGVSRPDQLVPDNVGWNIEYNVLYRGQAIQDDWVNATYVKAGAHEVGLLSKFL
jgi:hypothetical protein